MNFPRAVTEAVPCAETKQNLVTRAELIEGSEIHPVIERAYPFAEIPAAVSYQEEGHASGKVVISL